MENFNPVSLLLLALVFLPSIVAECRRHRNVLAITVLNIFALVIGIGSISLAVILGVIGFPIGTVIWIGALIWSCTNNVRPRNEPQTVDKRWKNLRSQ